MTYIYPEITLEYVDQLNRKRLLVLTSTLTFCIFLYHSLHFMDFPCIPRARTNALLRLCGPSQRKANYITRQIRKAPNSKRYPDGMNNSLRRRNVINDESLSPRLFSLTCWAPRPVQLQQAMPKKGN